MSVAGRVAVAPGILGVRKDALAMPAVAVQRGPDGAFGSGRGRGQNSQGANRRCGKHGHQLDDSRWRERGRDRGHRGQSQLKPGALVEAREPGENRDQGGRKGKGASAVREAKNP